ncbi:MAG TPA: cytochrome c family protein [Magnetospirillaceae bacterium]|nr:cytochrome c family protein [Magnetospirillaceae bacterium]
MFFKTLMVGATAAALCAGVAEAGECSLSPEAQSGQAVSKQCMSCHVIEADKPSRPTAPNIHEVFGSLPAGRKDYPYSDGMIGASAKGATWTEAALFDYLADPKAYLNRVNGAEVKHKMFFQLKDEQKRHDVIAFLKAIKGKPECN